MNVLMSGLEDNPPLQGLSVISKHIILLLNKYPYRKRIMQKIVNVLAIASGVVSAAVVASGVFVYVNRDSIVDSIKSQAIEAVTGSLGGGLGGSLPIGAPDLASPTPQAAAPAVPSAGLGISNF